MIVRVPCVIWLFFFENFILPIFQIPYFSPIFLFSDIFAALLNSELKQGRRGVWNMVGILPFVEFDGLFYRFLSLTILLGLTTSYGNSYLGFYGWTCKSDDAGFELILPSTLSKLYSSSIINKNTWFTNIFFNLCL